MGYYTYHDLSMRIPEDSVYFGKEVEIIENLKSFSTDAEYGLNDDGSCADQTKWYDLDDDMALLSPLYPDVLFVVDGQGENSGDRWRTYFKNGKKQEAKVELVIEEFDENKLI